MTSGAQTTSTGLSKSAKTGLGVGFGIAGAALVVVTLLYLCRRKQRYEEVRPTSDHELKDEPEHRIDTSHTTGLETDRGIELNAGQVAAELE